MCGAKPPTPVAPPAPVSKRDEKIDATRNRQSAAAGSAASGYEATMLTAPGGAQGAAPTASPVLGG